MILGADPAFAKLGWAISDPERGIPVELGVIVTHPHPDVKRNVKVDGKKVRIGTIDQSADRARRMLVACHRLRQIVAAWNAKHPDKPITAIAVEQMLVFGAAAAVTANILPWGAMAMLAAELGVPLIEVRAQTWQHAVLGTELVPGKKTPKVNYAVLERAMAGFIGRHAGAALEAIPKDLRNHAIDATGVNLLAALRPQEACWIERRAEG